MANPRTKEPQFTASMTSTQEAQSSGRENFEFDPNLLDKSIEDIELGSTSEQKLEWHVSTDIELMSTRNIQVDNDFQTESDSTRSGPTLKINHLGKVTFDTRLDMNILELFGTFLR